MAASGASLNWDKFKAIMLGSWKNIPSPFPCPVLSQVEQLRCLGIFLSGAKRPPNPWQAKLPKIKARLELWERFKPSLFARANVALTMIALCARYHASCAAASRDAIKELQTLTRKFVWKGRAPVCTDLASVPRRLGGLGLPNI